MLLVTLLPTILAVLGPVSASSRIHTHLTTRTDFRENTCTPDLANTTDIYQLALSSNNENMWGQRFMFDCDLYPCMRMTFGPVGPGPVSASAVLFRFLPGFGSGVQINPKDYKENICLSAPALYSDITVAGCRPGTANGSQGPEAEREWIIACNGCSSSGGTHGTGCSFKVKGYNNQCASASLGAYSLMHLDDCTGKGDQLFDIIRH